jgi:hypothetical protein
MAALKAVVGGGNTTQTSYSTNLPEYAKPYYEELLKQSGQQIYKTDPSAMLQALKNLLHIQANVLQSLLQNKKQFKHKQQDLTQPGQFGGATAGLGAGTTMGLGAGMTGLGQAFSYSPMAVSGGTFDAPAASYYMSPYQSNVTDIAVREARRQGDIERSRGALGAIGRGTFGGARQSLMQSEQDRNLAQNIGDIRTRGQQEAFMNAQQQFERDQARRMQAAQLGQQAQQYQAGLGKDIGLAGLTAGLQGSQALGALRCTTTTK